MKENRLKSDIGTIMLVTFARTTTAYKAMYVGMEPGAYVILRFPSGAGIHDHLFEGNEAVIKYISAGEIYGFRSEVIGYLYKKRLILVVMAYPQSVEVHKLRRESRVEFLVPAQITAADREFDGFVMDISPSGCRFAFESAKASSGFDSALMKEVIISFHFPGIEGMKELHCKVKNVNQEGSPVSMGLEFAEVHPGITDSIRDYVQQVSTFLEKEKK